MPTLSYVNNTSNLASSYLNRSMGNVENSLKRLASGEKFAHMGEGVPEKSISNSLKSSVSALKMGRTNATQALKLLDAAYSVMNDSYNILSRQREIAMQAASDTMTDLERKNLDIDYQNLLKQIRNNANFEYNGIKVLDGTYAGATPINTYKGTKIVNVFDDISQFSATGTIGENALLQPGSTIEAVDNIGKTYGKATITTAGYEGGGIVTIGSQPIYLITDQTQITDPTTQVYVPPTAGAAAQALVTFLNASTLPDIAANNYTLNTTNNNITITRNTRGFDPQRTPITIRLASVAADYFIMEGSDLRTRAAAVVNFDPAANYSNGDQISLNGQKFKFSTTPVAQTDIQIGSSLSATLNNLQKKLATTPGPASHAIIESLPGSNSLTIKTKKAGVLGNSYSFNFGGGTAAYSYEDGVAVANMNNRSFTATIEGLVNGTDLSSQNAKPIAGTQISTDDLTFDQNMQGVFSECKAVFTPGSISGTSFTPNSIQFMAYLNNELYQTAPITLAGGNLNGSTANGRGYLGLGDHIAGGTQLTFHKVGAPNTDANFQVTVKDEGVTITATTLPDIMKQLNAGGDSVTNAMKIGEVRLNILGSSYTVKDFGLDGVSQFFSAGSVKGDSAVVDPTINVHDAIGITNAQGTVRLVKNVVTGDQVTINGTAIIFGTNVNIGTSIEQSRDNLLSFLNKSTDAAISQATYFAASDYNKDEHSIVVRYKEPGVIGNNFTLATNNNATMKLNDLTLTSTTLGAVNLSQTGVAAGTYASGKFVVKSPFDGAQQMQIKFWGNTLPSPQSFVISGPNAPAPAAGSPPEIKITGSSTVGAAAASIVAGINNWISSNPTTQLSDLAFSSSGSGIIAFTAKTPGSAGNRFGTDTLDASLIAYPSSSPTATGTQYQYFSGGSDTAVQTIVPSRNVVAGTNIDQIPGHQIADTLQGALENLSATFNEGAVNPYVAGKFDPNFVSFSTTVGGQIYNGKLNLSGGSITANKASGANYNRLGDKIAAGNVVSLVSADKTHALKLTFNRNVDLSGQGKLEVVSKLSNMMEDMKRDLSDVKIYQTRVISSANVAEADGTVLEGIRQENLRVSGADFTDEGGYKSISQFKFDAETNTLSVKLGELEYSQVLSDSVAAGGLGERYDVTNKTIRGGMDTTIMLKNSSTDNFLSINLQGVNNIDLSSDKKVYNFISVLNSIFSSEGSGGLSFQVGSAEDIVTIQFNDIGEATLYRDSDGNIYKDNTVTTKEKASRSYQVVDRALKYLSGEIAAKGAVSNQLMNIERKLSAVTDTMDDAIANLMFISLPEAATSYAAESLRLQAATTAHGYHNNTVKELVSSVLRG